jgi:ADP-ribose pyrophosphatase YjhB (NUDIX family)
MLAGILASMRRGWRFISTVIGVVFRHPVPGISIVPVLDDGTIVLVRRRDTGKWSLPGGMIDWGDDIIDTVRRELAEETGLELQKITRLVGVYSAADRDPRIHSICNLVEAKVKGSINVEDTLEISEAKAFAIASLPLGDLSHDHDRQLQDYLQGVTRIA